MSSAHMYEIVDRFRDYASDLRAGHADVPSASSDAVCVVAALLTLAEVLLSIAPLTIERRDA